MMEPNLESGAGTLAVGALSMAGCAAAAQSFVDLKEFFVALGSSAVWSIFIAAPVLVLSYLLGLVTTRAAAWAFGLLRRERAMEQIATLVLVGRCGAELVVSEYKRAARELEFLQGSCLALGGLALALAVKVARASPDLGGHLRNGRPLFALVAALFVGSLPVVAAMVRDRARFLTELARELRAEGRALDAR